MEAREFRTRELFGEVTKWREVDGKVWDNTDEHRREILYLGKGKGIALVVKVS